MNLNKILNKNQRILLVNGYIRNIQELIIHQIIPTSINSICFEYYDIIIDSLILNVDEQSLVLELLQRAKMLFVNELTFDLVYRGSRDGFQTKDFYSKAKDKSKTIIIIQTQSNNVFGGYVSVKWPWDGKAGYKTDKTAFLMLLRSSKGYKPDVYPVKNAKCAIYHFGSSDSSYIFGFGGGVDIGICSNCNTTKNSTTNKQDYALPSRNYLNGDVKSYFVTEMELFSCQ